MSDFLREFLLEYQLAPVVLPVVTAVLLVVLVYLFSLKPSPTPPLFHIDEDIASKKHKTLKKKLKSSNAKNEGVTALNSNAVQSKPNGTVEKLKSTNKKGLKSDQKDEADEAALKIKSQSQKAPARNARVESAVQMASKNDKVVMKKQAVEGDWIVATSRKDKKQKGLPSESPTVGKAVLRSAQEEVVSKENAKAFQAAPTPIQTSEPSVTGTQKTKERKAKEPVKQEPVPVKPSTAADTGSTSNTSRSEKGTKPASKKKELPEAKPSNESKGATQLAPKEPQVETTKAVTVETRASAPVKPVLETSAPVKPVLETSADSGSDKLPAQPEPVFDEMGDWEEAKPLKMKNVKKRARREK